MTVSGRIQIGAVSILSLISLLAWAQQPDRAAMRSQPEMRSQYVPRMSEGNGAPQFGAYCRSCHGNAQVERAPDPSVLKSMSPERIYAALTTGAMKQQAKDLTDADKRAIAEYLAGRRLGTSGSADARTMSNRCSGDASIRYPSSFPSWNGWGVDMANTRFQPVDDFRLKAGRILWRLKVAGAAEAA